MISEDEVTGYTVRDYSALNDQIKQMGAREAEMTRRLRYANYYQLAIVAAIFCAAIGILLLLAGVGWRFAQSYDRKSLEQTVIEYKGLPDQNIIVGSNDPSEATQIDPRTAILQEENEGAEIKKDVTYFVTRETGMTDFSVVTTGVTYKKATDLVPIERFCYSGRDSKSGVFQRVSIGFQETGRAVELQPRPNITGLSAAKYQRLAGYCAWGANAETVVQ